MAKKKTSTSKTSPAAKAKGGRASSSKKTSSMKSQPKKVAKKTAAKTVTKKTATDASKIAPKKAPAKKTTKKTAKAASKPAKKTITKTTTKKSVSTPAKTTSKPSPVKKAPVKKAPAKKDTKKNAPKAEAAKKPSKQEVAAPPPPSPASAAPTSNGPPGKDGAPNRPSRPKRPKPPVAVMPEGIGGLLSPGGPVPKPLISSSDRRDAEAQPEIETYPTKSPFNKRDLEKYRQILLTKRAQVLAEVTGLEGDALTGSGSGNLSHTPQHMADAGSDAADQTLSLDLAAAERNLIREIDAALKRIADGVFGLCVATGRPIRTERLAELPWARYSIDAARQFEGRRGP